MRYGSISFFLLVFCIKCFESLNIVRVDGEFRHSSDVEDSHFQRRREAAAAFNRRHHNVILAPLEGHRVITKEKMYINANEERDDSIYEKLLTHSKTADMDSFFVTEPPLRTTMAEREELPITTTTTEPPLLRLVTLSKLATTPPPPFRFASKTPSELKILPPLIPQFDVGNSAIVRFPAQPWQLPPKNLQRTVNSWNQLFEPPKLFPGIQPLNPFLSPQTPLQNTTNPFIPIGISNPTAYSPYNNFMQTQHPQLIQSSQPAFQPPRPLPLQTTPPFEVPLVHKSPLRNSGYGKQAQLAPIPLPSDSSVYSSDQRVPRRIPSASSEIFIDSTSHHYTMEETNKNGAKIFVSNGYYSHSLEGGSDQLKQFVKSHPNLMNTVKRPIMKESQLVLPKSLQTSHPIIPVAGPPASAPTSSLTPNQKLYLCCQKQQVGIACQGMCNFDTFSDKSLVSAFLTNQCPGPQLGKAYDCASSKADHSTCCERNGIGSFQGGRCMPFCRTHLATPANVFEYLPCLQVFETIKYCYREYQVSNKNFFGD